MKLFKIDFLAMLVGLWRPVAVLASAGIIMIAFAACPTEDDGGSDPAPIASVSVSQARVNEGGAVTATVTLDRAVDSAATFILALGSTGNGSGDADVDGADDDDAAFVDGVNTVTIAANNTTGTAMIAITDDDITEDDETFTVGLASGQNGVTLSTAVATVTISDNDGGNEPAPIASVSVSQARVNEGGTVTATVTLDRAVDSAATFILALGATAATDDADANVDGADADATYVGGTDTVTIAANTTTGTAMIAITDDTITEDDETFTVGLASGPDGVILSEAVATVTIASNDQATATLANSFSASSGSISEGGEPATITIGLDGPAAAPLSFGYTIGGVEAADIVGTTLSGTIGVALGAQSGTATITIADDALIEGDETMTVTLASSNPPLPIAGSIVPITLTIGDNDTLSVEIAASTYAFAEDAATPVVMLNVSGGALVGSDAEVSLTTSAGTATEADFTARSGADAVVPIPVDDYTTAQEISVPLEITDDTILEIDETFSLQLSAPDGRVEVGSTSSAEVTIMGGGDPVTATIGIAATATEGETVTATVTLTNQVGVDTTLTLALSSTADPSDLDADVDGMDDNDDASFSGGSNAVTIAAGMTTGSADITITNDDVTEEAEEAETFVVGFSLGAVSFAVSGGTISPTMINVLENHFTAIDAQVVTIQRNDQTEASQVTGFTATPTTIGEDGGDVTIEIVLDGEAQSQLSFGYAITGIAAADIAGDALTGTIDVALTDTMGMATITIEDDALIEGDETMTITLGTLPTDSGSGNTLVYATGVNGEEEVTITDNDTATATVIVSGATSEGDTATVTVTLDIGLVVDATFPLELGNTADTSDSDADVDGMDSDDDAALAASPMVTIVAGMTNTAQTVDLMITDDSAIDPDETFEVRIGAITFGGGRDLSSLVTPVAATVTIADDEIPRSATLSVTDSTLTERAADGTSGGEAEFTLALTGLPTEGTEDVSVFFTLSGFAGALGDDDSVMTRLQTVTTTIGGDMGAGPHDLDANDGTGRVNLDRSDGDIAADGGSTVVFRIGLPNFDDNTVDETIILTINCVARSRIGRGPQGCMAASVSPNLLNNPIVARSAVIDNDAEITGKEITATISVTDGTVTEQAADGTPGREAEFTLSLVNLPTDGDDDISVFFTLSGFAGTIGSQNTHETRLFTFATTTSSNVSVGPFIDATTGTGRIELDRSDGDINPSGGSTAIFQLMLPNSDGNTDDETITLTINCVARSRTEMGRDGCIDASADPNPLNNPIVRRSDVINNDAMITVTDDDEDATGALSVTDSTVTEEATTGDGREAVFTLALTELPPDGDDNVSVFFTMSGFAGTIGSQTTHETRLQTFATTTGSNVSVDPFINQNTGAGRIELDRSDGDINTNRDSTAIFQLRAQRDDGNIVEETITLTIDCVARSRSGQGQTGCTSAGNSNILLADSAVGGNGAAITVTEDDLSTPGNVWQLVSPVTPNVLNAVAWAGSQWVAVGSNGTILTGVPDADTWTVRTSGTSLSIRDVASNPTGSLIVAVGNTGTILTSSNGITWTTRTSGTNRILHGVIWADSQWVVVGDRTTSTSSTATILTSSNGINWTPRNSGPVGQNLFSVASDGSQLVAVGASGSILTSSNGATWTERNPPGSFFSNLFNVVNTGSQWVTVGNFGDILTSSDGITWTSRNSGTGNNLRGITWTGTLLVTVGSSSTIRVSSNGINWMGRNSPSTVQLNGVASTNSRVVAVGNSGVIIRSP